MISRISKGAFLALAVGYLIGSFIVWDLFWFRDVDEWAVQDRFFLVLQTAIFATFGGLVGFVRNAFVEGRVAQAVEMER